MMVAVVMVSTKLLSVIIIILYYAEAAQHIVYNYCLNPRHRRRRSRNAGSHSADSAAERKILKLSFEYLHIYSPKSGDFCRKK